MRGGLGPANQKKALAADMPSPSKAMIS